MRIDINVTPQGINISGDGVPKGDPNGDPNRNPANNPHGQPIQKIFLNAPTILRYLIGSDQTLSDLIILGSKPMMTTDKELYEALGSIAKYDDLKPTKLSKLFEVVDVYPHRDLTRTKKPLLTFEKVEAIRKEALKNLPTESKGTIDSKKEAPRANKKDPKQQAKSR
jgi:hypothetical protein